MKKREKIMGIYEHPEQRIVREKLWYFSDENADSINVSQQGPESERTGGYSKFPKGKNDYPTSRLTGRNRFRRDNSFVVDWQLSDN